MSEPKTSHRRKRERGSTLVEFALTVLPLFALLLLTLDLSWMLFAYASLQEAVREGVRFAITGQSDASIRQVVQSYSFGFVRPADAASQISIQYFSPTTLAPLSGAKSNSGGNIVKISITGLNVNPMGPLWHSSTPVVLGASSSDVMEASPPGGPPSR